MFSFRMSLRRGLLRLVEHFVRHRVLVHRHDLTGIGSRGVLRIGGYKTLRILPSLPVSVDIRALRIGFGLCALQILFL